MNIVNTCCSTLALSATMLCAAPTPQLGILTPPEGNAPRINGTRVYGVRPGRPILWRLPVTGKRPIQNGREIVALCS